MLKTLSTKLVKPRKSIVGVGDDSKAGHDWSKIIDDEVNNKVENEVEKKGRNPSKFKNLSKSKKTELSFLTSV